jgi:hypothetical protein
MTSIKVTSEKNTIHIHTTTNSTKPFTTMKKLLFSILALTAVTSTCVLAQKAHPAYLHALSDLRAARWMLEHRPGNWKATSDEVAAVNEINAAIGEIKKASIDDGKDINDHPQAQEINEHKGRLTKAVEWLRKSRSDIEQDEDNGFAQGLRKRAFGHIDEAIRLTLKAQQS